MLEHSIDYELYLINKEIDEQDRQKRQIAAKKQRYLEQKRIARTRRREIRRMSIMTVFFCMLMTAMLYLYQDIQFREAKLDTLNNEIMTLHQTNLDTEKRLSSSVDINYIKQQAARLGMIQVGSHNITYYSLSEDEFMISIAPDK